MRTMYDSTNVEDIPGSAQMVAVYRDGLYQTEAQARRRFPHAQIVTITVLGRGAADVVDCEPGNVGPDGAAAWAAERVKAGAHPTIYCPLSMWPAVKAAVKAHGISSRKVSYWIAHYNGERKIPDGAVAVQYADPTLSGGHYDVSAVADYWPGVDPKPRRPRLPKGKRATARKLLGQLHRRIPDVAGDDRRLLVKVRRQINRLTR